MKGKEFWGRKKDVEIERVKNCFFFEFWMLIFLLVSI